MLYLYNFIIFIIRKRLLKYKKEKISLQWYILNKIIDKNFKNYYKSETIK